MEYVVWLDSSQAKIFTLKAEGIEHSLFKKVERDHHTHNKKDHHGDASADHFYHDLAVRLKDAEKLLLLGPGEGKTLFNNHLEEHHKSGLAKKVIGVQTVDHPTDNQILAVAREFFKSYNLFHSPLKSLT